jgi:hypothetical protein
MNDLEWLMNWYSAQCDGVWEHQCGVNISTLDNPGWIVTIDLRETSLEHRAHPPVQHNLDNPENEEFWWSCHVDAQQWHAACGAQDLATVLGIFRDWANSS